MQYVFFYYIYMDNTELTQTVFNLENTVNKLITRISFMESKLTEITKPTTVKASPMLQSSVILIYENSVPYQTIIDESQEGIYLIKCNIQFNPNFISFKDILAEYRENMINSISDLLNTKDSFSVIGDVDSVIVVCSNLAKYENDIVMDANFTFKGDDDIQSVSYNHDRHLKLDDYKILLKHYT
jgi:hypothetical protein